MCKWMWDLFFLVTWSLEENEGMNEWANPVMFGYRRLTTNCVTWHLFITISMCIYKPRTGLLLNVKGTQFCLFSRRTTNSNNYYWGMLFPSYFSPFWEFPFLDHVDMWCDVMGLALVFFLGEWLKFYLLLLLLLLLLIARAIIMEGE